MNQETELGPSEVLLVYARWGCGACWPCLRRMENLCEAAAGDLGGHGDGTDAALTSYHAIKRWLPFGARCTSPPGGRFPS